MDTRLVFGDAAGQTTPLLVVFAVDVATEKGAEPLPALLTTSDTISSAAATALGSGEFKAGLAEMLVLHAPQGLKAERLLVLGLGKAADLSLDRVRKGAGTAVRSAKPRGLRELSVAFPDDHALSDEHLDELSAALIARALVEGAQVGEMDWDTYRSERQDCAVHGITFVAPNGEASERQEIEAGFAEGVIVAAGQNFARALVNEPGNVLTPTELGARTKAMCDDCGARMRRLQRRHDS